MSLATRKSIADLQSTESGGPTLRRALGPLNLTTLGIGSVIGTGIFVLTGAAASQHAGPALVLSMIIAAIACALAGLCYAELASMIPIAGSAYTYAYASSGEFVAWMIGWDLILEYALSMSTIAVGWSGYFVSFMRDLGIHLPPALTAAPGVGTMALDGTMVTGVFNLPAALIVVLVAGLLMIGIRQSAGANTVLVVIKVAVLLLFIAFGAAYVRRENLTPFIPPNTGEFGSFGWSGVLRGAAVMFFAYVGFDAVSTAAQEARHPQRDMPIGILASLAICTVIYIAVAIVLIGIVPYQRLNVADPIAVGIDATGLTWFSPVVKISALFGLFSTMLVQLLGQTRIFYSMSRDGLLPDLFSSVHPRFRTPHLSTIVTGGVVAIAAGMLPIAVLSQLVSIGSLLAFVLVCIGVIVLRRTAPDVVRPFRTPGVPWVPVLGALICVAQMVSLPWTTWERLLVWLVLGLAIYFGYSRHRARAKRKVGKGWSRSCPNWSTMKSSSRFLVLLLALTVALAAMLAFEAQRAARSHRVTAERALRDYATVAAWEFLTATGEALDRTLGQAFGPVLGTPAASPYDSLPPPGTFAASSRPTFGCPSPSAAGRFTFMLDLRSGTLTTDGPAATPVRQWLRDSVLARSARETPAAGHAELLWGEGAVAVYGVKVLRYSGFAQHDAPVAAYGMVTCPSALLPIFSEVMKSHPLLPRPVTGGISNVDLVSLRVTDPRGRPLFESGAFPPGGYAGDSASNGVGSLVVAASLPPETAGRLVVATPGARLPVLAGLLVLAAGLALVAVRQLRREQELARLRADFTSSVSHELRTPLTQILLFAETLELGRATGEDARRQGLAIIVQEARRLAHLVENVLQFSRAERRLTWVRPETLALAPLVREIVERFTPLAGSAAVRLRTELDEGLVANVHPESLHQILLNLLDNAVKHGGTGGPIVLRTRLQAGRTRIEVEDAGAGIPPADRSRVWEPYVRLGAAAAGSGIGLAVVRGLVAAHGGECWVEDGAAGVARFVVELPGGRRVVESARPERIEAAEG